MIKEFEDLVGHTLVNVEVGNDSIPEYRGMLDYHACELIFTLKNRKQYMLNLFSTCCEEAKIVNIQGNLKDLIGSPILLAEVETEWNEYGELITVHKIATKRYYVEVYWLSASMCGCLNVDIEWTNLIRIKEQKQ